MSFEGIEESKTLKNGELKSTGLLEVVGIKVGMNGQIEKGDTKESEHRIKFSIPIFPQGEK